MIEKISSQVKILGYIAYFPLVILTLSYLTLLVQVLFESSAWTIHHTNDGFFIALLWVVLNYVLALGMFLGGYKIICGNTRGITWVYLTTTIHFIIFSVQGPLNIVIGIDLILILGLLYSVEYGKV